jgi:hypothetical protein
MRQRPFANQPRRVGGEPTRDQVACLDRNMRFMVLVNSVKVRRRMIAEVHSIEDSIEGCDRRHAITAP